MHGHMAMYLERYCPDDFFGLAAHFDAAGFTERALRPALRAALASRRMHSLKVAQSFYEIALRGIGRHAHL